QHQRQLLADPALPDEVAQPLGPQRSLDHPLIGSGQWRDEAVLLRLGQLWCRPGRLLRRRVRLACAAGPRFAQARLSFRSAARSMAATSTSAGASSAAPPSPFAPAPSAPSPFAPPPLAASPPRASTSAATAAIAWSASR